MAPRDDAEKRLSKAFEITNLRAHGALKFVSSALFRIADFSLQGRRDVFVEDRYDGGAILLTSQMPIDRWHDIVVNPTACLSYPRPHRSQCLQDRTHRREHAQAAHTRILMIGGNAPGRCGKWGLGVMLVTNMEMLMGGFDSTPRFCLGAVVEAS